MTFKAWISRCKASCNPVGDLAKRISRDKDFPKSNDYQLLLDYLTNKNVPTSGIDVFKFAYQEYLKTNSQ